MKKILSIFTILFISVSVFAQSPEKLSYQAVVRNAENNLVINQAIGIKISILFDNEAGAVVWSNTHQTPTTNGNGLFSIVFGESHLTQGFADIDWSAGSYFIKAEIDPTGGVNYTITSISQLLSVPYALYAKTAETADYNNLSNKPQGTNVGDIQYWNGTSWNNVAVGLPGQFLQLSSTNIPTWIGTLPTVITLFAEASGMTSGICGAQVTATGSFEVTSRGVCWSLATNPTIGTNNFTVNDSGTGSYTGSITGLAEFTTYYVRAYAINLIGTSYGEQMSFTTGTAK